MSPVRFATWTRIPLFAAILVLACPWGKASDKVEFSGLFTIPQESAEEWLKTPLAFVESQGVSMAQADDLAYFLENAMRERGYESASVDWKIVGEGEQERIVLEVSEGTVATIRSFTIDGNSALEDPAIIELLTEATRTRLKLPKGAPVPFVPADLPSGEKKLVNFYQLLGFMLVEVDITTDASSSEATVAVTITEGPQQTVVSISLPEPPTEGLAEDFEELQKEFSNKSFNPQITGNLRSRLRALAVNAGYYEAAVEIEERPIGEVDPPEQYELVASLDWGPAVALHSVSVEGNSRVQDKFFRRHFDGLVGEPYSPEKTNKAVEQLLQTGAFETIRTDPVRQPDGSFALEVDVEESFSRTLAIYAGSTNYEGAIGGFEFTNLNLFGNVRTLDSRIEFSKRGAKGQVNYNDPWFLDTDIRFRGGVFGQTREEEGYDKWETGGNYEFTKRFGRNQRNMVSLFGRASYTEIDDSAIPLPLIGDTNYFVHAVGVSLSHDRRDNPRLPRKGFIAQTSASLSSSGLGSDVEFFKATGRLGWYHPVGNHTFRLAARGGVISPMGNTQAIPIDLRFFNGGPLTVRSFQERSLGPIDQTSGNPLGGEFYTVFNAEYEIPISALEGLSVVGFTDAGNVLLDASQAGFSNMRYAVGLGLRYTTPIGPIRLEYGYNPDQQPGEPQGTFHFGFGFSY